MSAADRPISTVGRIERWIFAPGDARRLAGVRIGLCLVLAGRLSRPMYLEMTGQPRVLFRPISFMRMFPSMPSAHWVLAIQVVSVLACLLGAAGLFASVALPVAWVGSLFLNGMWASVGQPMHNETFLILGLFPLLFAPTADAWPLRARWTKLRPPEPSPRYGWPVRTAMIVVAGGYFFSGLNKLIYSGPAWFLSDNLRWVLYGISDQNPRPIGPAIFLASHPILSHLAAAGTFVAELGFPLVLRWPRSAWFFIPAVVALHVGIGLTMHLDYSAWALTVIVLFVPWDGLADWRALAGHRDRDRRMALIERDLGDVKA
jgi:hypothetical protein